MVLCFSVVVVYSGALVASKSSLQNQRGQF